MEKYKLVLDTQYWECGDGCCSGDSTTMTVNGIEIGGYADLSMEQLNGLTRFMEILNKNDQDLILSFTAELDEDGDLKDAIVLNDTKISNSFWASHMYSDILDKLQITYLYRSYDLDWDIWSAEKRLVLALDEEETRNPLYAEKKEGPEWTSSTNR